MMIASNAFLLVPALCAALYGEWVYFVLASGLCIISPAYHWYRIHRTHARLYPILQWLDGGFAVASFVYMYYRVSHFETQRLVFLALLTLVVLFFLYGRRRDYAHLHPWFHVVAPIISAAIVAWPHR